MSKFKISPNDIRVGNFVYHDESNHIKISDIQGNVTHRISKFVAKGQILMAAMQNSKEDEGQKTYLENYAVVTFNFLSAVPDSQLFSEVLQSTVDCINRHKDIYGIKEDIAKKEDDQILAKEKVLNEAMEQMKKEEGAE